MDQTPAERTAHKTRAVEGMRRSENFETIDTLIIKSTYPQWAHHNGRPILLIVDSLKNSVNYILTFSNENKRQLVLTHKTGKPEIAVVISKG